MLSPYFSPCRKRGSRRRLVNETLTKDSKEDQETNHAEPVFEHFFRHDPLLCFYFRKFLDLYQLLSALKPILIQGIVIQFLNALTWIHPSS